MSAKLCYALAAFTFIPLTLATRYALQQDYLSSPSTFFSNFDFFTDPDPTHGTVRYVSSTEATAANLVGWNRSYPTMTVSNSTNATITTTAAKPAVYLGVETNSTAFPPASVRITSHIQYQPGALLVARVSHLPTGCGVWPALWLLGAAGADWPFSGEIDIVEGVNLQRANTLTLHTSPGCRVAAPSAGSMRGALVTPDCDVAAPDQPANQGCQIAAPAGSRTFGAAANAAGGGTWVAEWDERGVRVWFFGADEAEVVRPGAAVVETRRALGGRTPLARFEGQGCDFSARFRDLNVVLDTTLCGDWAGAPTVWAEQCAARTGFATCEEWIASPRGRGEGLQEAYWMLEGLAVYTRG